MLKNLRWRHASKTRRFQWAAVYTLGAGAISGFYAAWPVFMSSVEPRTFAAVSTLLGFALAGAHLLKIGGDE